MKKTLLLITLVLLPLVSLAQSSGSVRVKLDRTAQQAVNSNSKSVDLIKGYRVCIFSDNSQNARNNAQKVLNEFNTLPIDAKATMEYDNPFFRVYTGYCLNRNEAVRLLGKLKPSFPLAIISNFSFELDKLNPEENIFYQDDDFSLEDLETNEL